MRTQQSARARQRDEGTERALALGLDVFAETAQLPLLPETVEAFRRTYRRSARRAQDPRAWRLVWPQLKWWLGHQGRLALAEAKARGAQSISVEDLRTALRTSYETRASSYCEPDVPPPPPPPGP